MRRVTTVVPLNVCKSRCLVYMASNDHVGMNPMKASAAVQAIWPGVTFTGQGAGAAVSRVLRILTKEGLVKWLVIYDGPRGKDWGYVLTTAGIRAVGKAATEMAMMDDQPEQHAENCNVNRFRYPTERICNCQLSNKPTMEDDQP